ncbi:hypothetical protein EY672_15060 [Enterococcus gallinarum]|nr:hypothetical protein [Enterococcus gallinarum]TKL04524.1 hypothetical protein DVW06_13725 [Enterococcus sp. ARL09-542]TXT67884.1 hypothetical protein D4N12_14500 [Enterococcus gallinarum]
MCCGSSILQKGLPFFYLHKIFYTLFSLHGNQVIIGNSSLIYSKQYILIIHFEILQQSLTFFCHFFSTFLILAMLFYH